MSGIGNERHRLQQERAARCTVTGAHVQHLYVAGDTSLQAWLDSLGMSLAEDLSVDAETGCLTIGKPLRVELATTGTIVARVQPLWPARNHGKLWCHPGEEPADYFQVINQRVQNHQPHLRHLPGMYDLDTWMPEEWDAVAPTALGRFALPPRQISTLVVTWGPDGYDPVATRTWAYLNGVQVADLSGSLRTLFLTHEAVCHENILEATHLWQRMALLCGVRLLAWAEMDRVLEPVQAEALCCSTWRDTSSLAAAIPAPDAPAPAASDLYANAPGARVRGVDCEPVDGSLPLEARFADRLFHWQHEAKPARGEQALAGIPDGEPVRWHVDVPADGAYHLVLHYSMLMPPERAQPRASVQVDGKSPGSAFTDAALPPTTASGPLRPEPERFKPVPLAREPVQLTAGRHELALTFQDNNFLVLDEILLTPWAWPIPKRVDEELLGYVRPPLLEVCGLDEGEEASLYTLRFHNAATESVRGKLCLDEASDPGPQPALSQTELTFTQGDSREIVLLTVPAEADAISTRRIRIVFAEQQGRCRRVYTIRHRRPFALDTGAARAQSILPLVPWIPEDREQWPKQAERLVQDERLAAWRDRTPEELRQEPPPLTEGHGNASLRKMATLVALTQDRALAERLKAAWLTHVDLTMMRLTADAYGERRLDTRGAYCGSRRGGIFGEIFPEDILAYDTLLAMDMLSPAEQLRVEGNLFWSAYEYTKRFCGELISRGQANSCLAPILLGVLTNDERILDDVEYTVEMYASRQVHTDGGHNERISSYGASVYNLVEYAMLLAQAGRPRVLEMYRDTVRAGLTSLIRGSFSDGSLLRQGDGGVQRSFHIFSINRWLAVGRELFPGDREFEELQTYSDAIYARLQAKWEHEPPATWPTVADALLRTSDLFPDSGWVILRSRPGPNRMEAGLDWSAMGDHGHPDKLNMVLYAFDEVLNMDLSYGWPIGEPHHECEGYAMRTASHTTVVADMECQLPGARGELWLFDDRDDIQVAWADAGRCYAGGICADRCVIVLGDMVVDLFGLTAGRIHAYDWFFHCLGSFESSLACAPRAPLCPPPRAHEKMADFPGYDVLANLQQTESEFDAQFQWTLDGYPQRPGNWGKGWLSYDLGTLHLAMLGEGGTSYVVGDAPFPLPTAEGHAQHDTRNRRPFLMVRRQARETLFAGVFQARADHGEPNTVQRLAVNQRGRALDSRQAIALQIQHPQGTVTVVQKHVAGPVHVSDGLATDARLLILRQDKQGKPIGLHAYQGCFVQLKESDLWRSTQVDDRHEV